METYVLVPQRTGNYIMQLLLPKNNQWIIAGKKKYIIPPRMILQTSKHHFCVYLYQRLHDDVMKSDFPDRCRMIKEIKAASLLFSDLELQDSCS